MSVEQRSAWKEAGWIFGLSRLMIVVFSYLGVTFLHVQNQFSTVRYIVLKKCPSNLNCFLLSWWHWDVIHYVEIAYLGYAHHQPLSAFFPLFPLLIRGLGMLLGGSIMADYATGMILANVCFYGILVLFYQLVCKDHGHITARYALIYLAFDPYGIFFFVGYTESLFFLLTLAVFVFLRRGKTLDWWQAGLCGCLVTLTRPTGVILLVSFFVLFVQRFGIRKILTRENWRQKLNAMLAMALVPAGLLIYMGYLRITFGSPWVFSIEQTLIWHRSLALPWVGPIGAIKGILTLDHSFFSRDLADVTFTLIPLTALIVGWKRLPLYYSLFSLVMVLFVLCEPQRFVPLMSVPRFMLVVFPVFILFALWSKDRINAWSLMSFFFIMFILNIILYVTNVWVA
jgi:hypothetical protein